MMNLKGFSNPQYRSFMVCDRLIAIHHLLMLKVI